MVESSKWSLKSPDGQNCWRRGLWFGKRLLDTRKIGLWLNQMEREHRERLPHCDGPYLSIRPNVLYIVLGPHHR